MHGLIVHWNMLRFVGIGARNRCNLVPLRLSNHLQANDRRLLFRPRFGKDIFDFRRNLITTGSVISAQVAGDAGEKGL